MLVGSVNETLLDFISADYGWQLVEYERKEAKEAKLLVDVDEITAITVESGLRHSRTCCFCYYFILYVNTLHPLQNNHVTTSKVIADDEKFIFSARTFTVAY